MPKRDDDLIRSLLLEMEASDEWLRDCPLTLGIGDDDEKEYYHLQLLRDQGFVEAVGRSADTYRMTAQGYDFLDAVRDDGIWRKTKSGAAQIGGVTLDILKDIAVGYVRKEATERLGISL